MDSFFRLLVRKTLLHMVSEKPKYKQQIKHDCSFKSYMCQRSVQQKGTVLVTANATPTNQCISLTPGSVSIWVEDQTSDTLPETSKLSVFGHMSVHMRRKHAAISACGS